jgi:hypothetical protein
MPSLNTCHRKGQGKCLSCDCCWPATVVFSPAMCLADTWLAEDVPLRGLFDNMMLEMLRRSLPELFAAASLCSSTIFLPLEQPSVSLPSDSCAAACVLPTGGRMWATCMRYTTAPLQCKMQIPTACCCRTTSQCCRAQQSPMS